ncbi:AlpA family transcriptional regulator [Thioalkalivibrio sp. ALJ16]|uniref:helix-turn-helix transcriptional regulator n=1 Tax=Thioalkalivibrio sp. ALJ16 TaxID=1158762 RepID=UPI00036ABE0A|nr:AlpA family phage regulatory protein [Thioalkalivibrio sp. ALJ16]
MADTTNESVYLSERDIARRYSIHPKTVWPWIHNQGFPQPIRLSPRCTRWRLEDLLAWEARRAGGAA